ncbi:hypothetical protein FF1_006971 [Malus domestica]
MAEENSCFTRVATAPTDSGAIVNTVELSSDYDEIFTEFILKPSEKDNLITFPVISPYFLFGSEYGTYGALKFKVQSLEHMRW